MKDSYLIKGGQPLKGELILSGAKNVALKTIIAALMFESEVILDNIPRINDVLDLLELLKLLGARADFIAKNKVLIDGRTLKTDKVDFLTGSKIRVSFMLFAPLLYRFGKCSVPNPGGCRIGARPIDRIIDGMKSLGIGVNYDHNSGYYEASLKDEIKGSYSFKKSSHTGTELLMLVSLMVQTKVVIRNVATEPEIDDLILFLNLSGAKIRKEDNNLIIERSGRLVQKKPYAIISDRNELVTYATLAIASKGDVIIGPINEELITSFLAFLTQVNGGVEKQKNNRFRFFYQGEIKAIDIETAPHPGIMTDWQPNLAILLTQSKGQSVIHERVFENRFSYVEELKKLGAKIEYFNFIPDNPQSYYYFNWEKDKKYSQAIKIYGPTQLHSGILTVFDLRAGAALACAALISSGESVVSGVSILERGYEDFVEKVKRLGGQIKKI